MKGTPLVAVVVLICTLFPSPLTATSDSLTLQECIELALAQNPLILSAADFYRASLARVSQARALTQPVFAYDSDLQPGFFDFGNSPESYVGFAFELDFPTKISARGNIAGKDAEVLLAENELLSLEIVYQTKQAFYGLLLARGNLESAEENLAAARDFEAMTETKFEEGEVAEVEALRARVEVAGALNGVRSATNEVRVARALLNFFLGRRQSETLEIEGELQVERVVAELDDLKQLAFLRRPEIHAVALTVEREEIAESLAKQSYLPDLEMGISRHRIESEPTTWDVTFGVTVPLFFWQPKHGEIAEARANLSALAQQREHVKNMIALEVEQAYHDAITARSQIELIETEILRQADEVYNMFLFSYQEGEIGGLDLIASRIALLGARKGYAEALHGYAVAMAALHKAVGQGS